MGKTIFSKLKCTQTKKGLVTCGVCGYKYRRRLKSWSPKCPRCGKTFLK